MALFEALGEFVASALLSSAPACKLTIPGPVAARPAMLVTWLRERGESQSLNAAVDALAREIWVGAETRSLSQQAIELHVQALTGLLPAHAPSATHLGQAIERASSGQPATVASGETTGRRLAVDVFARARASGAIGAASLKDDVALFLLDRMFTHLVDDAVLMAGLKGMLGDSRGARTRRPSATGRRREPPRQSPRPGTRRSASPLSSCAR